MRSAYRANDAARHIISRHEDLLGYPCDASLMVGFCGQVAWAHNEGVKANLFDRDVSRPGLFVRPAQEETGGFEFFDLTRNKITIERALSFSPRNDAPLTLAFSDLYKPRGGMGAPSEDEYTARLRSMLVPGATIDGQVVANDPLSGVPQLIYGVLPHLDAQGDIVMLEVEPEDAPRPSDDLAGIVGGTHTPTSDPAPPSGSGAPLASPSGGGASSVVGTPPSPTPAPPLPAPRGRRHAPSRPPRPPPSASESDIAAVALSRNSVLYFDKFPLHTSITVDPAGKEPAAGHIPSLSRLRLLRYASSRTLAEFFEAHPGTRAEARQDLLWDVQRDITRIQAPTQALPALVARVSSLFSPKRRPHGWVEPHDAEYEAWITMMELRLRPKPLHGRVLRVLTSPSSPAPHPEHGDTMRLAHQQRQELDRLDGLEDQPPFNVPSDFERLTACPGDPRLYAPAYLAAEAIARAGAVADYSEDPDGPQFGPSFHIPPSAVIFAAFGVDTDADPTPQVTGPTPVVTPPTPGGPQPAGTDPRAIPPPNVKAAMALPGFRDEHGWYAAMLKELNRVKNFKAWKVVSVGEMKRNERKYPGKVSLGFIVSVLTCKSNPDGGEIFNKFRIAVAESKGTELSVGQTYSSCADDISNRVITAIGPSIRAHQTTIDVGGAYYFGIPPTMEEGGRLLYAVMPPWLHAFGCDSDGTPYTTYGADGTRNVLLIQGNMPGRADAGNIWQKRFDTFLRGYGLRQLATDRRVWVLKSVRGILIIHDHVDDSRLTCTTPEARSHFYLAWAAEFNSAPESSELNEAFTGLRHREVRPGATEITCKAVIHSLVDLIAPFKEFFSLTIPAAPLPHSALKLLREQPEHQAEIRPDLIPHAQKIAGTIGFIVTSVRPDAYFAYCVLAAYVNGTRMSELAFRLLIRIARYLTHTIHLGLTLISPPPAPLGGLTSPPPGLDFYSTYVDSAHGNAPNGLSYGGFIILCDGGGALAWKCLAPAAGDDSTGAAELRMGTLAYKYILALRSLQQDLDIGVGPTLPTPLYTDAQAMIDGTGCERLKKSSRWMATRYAMIRWGLRCRSIRLAKVAADDNCSDIVTKVLTGELFERHRHTILGLAAHI
jgi:hypothetical protein